MDRTRSSSRLGFCDLPPEVRNHIYEYALRDLPHTTLSLSPAFSRKQAKLDMRGLMQTCKLIRHEFRPLYLPMKYVSVTADVAKRYIATYFPDTLKLTGRVEGRVDIILDPSKASHNELFWALKLGLRIYDIDIGFSGTITNTTHHRSAWLLTAALRTFRHAWTNAARGDIVGVGLVANGTVPGIRVTFSQAGKYMLDVRGKKARPRYFASMGLVEDVGRSQGNEIYLKRW